MAEAVASAIGKRQHLVVEAGTGVGKSFAYLVPAILAATAAGRRIEADSPRRRRHLHAHDQPAGAVDRQGPAAAQQRDPARVHGRAGQGPAQLPQPAAAGSARWRGRQACSTTTRSSTSCGSSATGPDRRRDGSLSDLDFRPLPQRLGRGGQRQRQLHGPQLPDLQASASTIAARRRVQNAQILVVNHALFFSDLALRRAGRQHPARLRRGDLRRGPHARGGGRRPPGHAASPAARSSTS